MTSQTYRAIEAHMLHCMSDAAHDCLHVYRVLYMALDIAAAEEAVDRDVLIAACLLHDIGRERQFRNPSLCHAREGAKMAYAWLLEQGWTEDRAGHVRDCVETHRFRSDNPPATLEAKILFDADKLEATGAVAVARCMFYSAIVGEPLYLLDEAGNVNTNPKDEPAAFFNEYNFKIRKVPGSFYTARAMEIGNRRSKAGDAYYDALLAEVRGCHEDGRALLEGALEEEAE